jgi:hypothetical protein
MVMNPPFDRSSSHPIETPRRTVKSPPSGVVLWNPGIVLAKAIRPVPYRPLVALGEPASRPEAVRSQIDATRSLLESLASARAALERDAVAADERGRHATSDAERVSTAADSYRIQARLDDVLTGAFRQINALMEERGLR